MNENAIKSADDLIGFIEVDAVCQPGVRLCDVDLVTGALRICLHGLLDTAEIDDIVAGTPIDLVRFQDASAALPIDDRPALGEWIARFNAGVTQLAA